MFLRRLLASVGVIIAVFMAVPTTFAQQTSGSGLSISPTRSELTINKGGAAAIEISLKNISGVDIRAKAVVNDFESNNESGEPKIITDTKEKSPNSIRDFLIDVEDVELVKEETKKFSVPVQIPENTTSGAYYGVIRYTAEPLSREEASEKQVALNASLGLIVLIQVPGNITEQVQTQKIGVERDGKSSSIFFAAPSKAYVTLKNTGNGFTKPFGRVAITKGDKEVFSYEMNDTDPRSNILPGATRTFKDDVKNITSLGRYTITANISYGNGGDVLTMKSSFWVLPLWFVGIMIIVIVIVLVIGLLLYRRLSKRRPRRR